MQPKIKINGKNYEVERVVIEAKSPFIIRAERIRGHWCVVFLDKSLVLNKKELKFGNIERPVFIDSFLDDFQFRNLEDAINFWDENKAQVKENYAI